LYFIFYYISILRDFKRDFTSLNNNFSKNEDKTKKVFFPKILKPGLRVKLLTSEEINTYKTNREKDEIVFDDSLKLNMRIQKIKNSYNQEAFLNRMNKLPVIKNNLFNSNKKIENNDNYEYGKIYSPFSVNPKKLHYEYNNYYEPNKLTRSPLMIDEQVDIFMP